MYRLVAKGKLNKKLAVCYLFVVAVLFSGCTLGRARLEIRDVSVNPSVSPLGPVIPLVK